MATAVAIVASLAFIGWIIYRAVKGKKPVKAHTVAYGIACVTGIFTLAFFLSMDIPQLVKIVVCIFLGLILVVVAAYLQRHQLGKP